MDVIVEKLVESYKENVNRALEENDTQEGHCDILREKFVSAFKTNLEIGLAAVFGNVKTVTKAGNAPLTEVSVDDMMRNGKCLTLTIILFCKHFD